MTINLAEAKNNAAEDYDPYVIDEFRKNSVILDNMVFDDVVNPAGGGSTLDYGYRRLITQANADVRKIGEEYKPDRVKTKKYTSSLVPLGGSFEVDRVEAKLGPAASGTIMLNLTQLIKAAKAKFSDLVINGDVAVDEDAFDGLDKALTGSATEWNTSGESDWVTPFAGDKDGTGAAHKVLDEFDEFLGLLDGPPTLVLANAKALARVRSVVRRSGQYVKVPVDDLIGQNGRPITVEAYGNVIFADPGEKAGSNDPIIPTVGGLTSLYAVRIAQDGFIGLATVGSQLVQTWLPDFTKSGAVHKGEVELGPVGVALKSTKAAAVWRNIRVAPVQG
jgi:hypothetical protein